MEPKCQAKPRTRLWSGPRRRSASPDKQTGSCEPGSCTTPAVVISGSTAADQPNRSTPQPGQLWLLKGLC